MCQSESQEAFIKIVWQFKSGKPALPSLLSNDSFGKQMCYGTHRIFQVIRLFKGGHDNGEKQDAAIFPERGKLDF